MVSFTSQAGNNLTYKLHAARRNSAGEIENTIFLILSFICLQCKGYYSKFYPSATTAVKYHTGSDLVNGEATIPDSLFCHTLQGTENI